MRLTIVSHVEPWPENHGGRIDISRMARALVRHGHEVQVVSPNQGLGPAPWAASTVRHTVADDPPPEVLADIGRFEADLVMLVGPLGMPTARAIAQRFNVQLVYRSHNREHSMMRIVARGGPRVAPIRPWRERIALVEAAVKGSGVRARELEAMRTAAQVCDISPYDLNLWKSEGFHNVTLLPAIASLAPCQTGNASSDTSDSGSRAASSNRFDVLLTGNLHQLHNLHGVAWFLQRVVPRLIGRVDPKRIAIAGGCHRESTLRALKGSGVTVIANPASMDELTRSSAVLVNAIHRTSGATVRTLELVESGHRAVSTSAGMQAYPWFAGLAGLSVEDDPNRFADAIVDLLEKGDEVVDRQQRANVICANHCPSLDHGVTLDWRLRMEALSATGIGSVRGR